MIDYPTFPTADQMADYLCAYAEHHDLYKHFRFGTNILKVAPTPSSPPQWSITFIEGEKETTEVFDRVVVTTGPQGVPISPENRRKGGISGYCDTFAGL
jgi:cation diffusion facilitator CzcD-associated flavoprotein CzcO